MIHRYEDLTNSYKLNNSLSNFQGSAGELFLNQLFRIFDKDGDGSIDFKVNYIV